MGCCIGSEPQEASVTQQVMVLGLGWRASLTRLWRALSPQERARALAAALVGPSVQGVQNPARSRNCQG